MISAILLVIVLAVPALAGTVTHNDTGNANPGFIAAADGAGIVVTDSESGSSGGLADTPWPKFGGPDLNNTGQSPYVGSQTGNPKWTFTVSTNPREITPVIGSDGTIYISDQSGKIYAVNPDGTSKWTFKLNAVIRGTPVIGTDGTLYYVCSSAGSLHAMNPDGTLKWQSADATGNLIYGSLAVGVDGTLYAGSDKLYAFNPEDGTLKWSYPTGKIWYGSPAVSPDGTIYVGSVDANISAVNPNGSLKWSYTTGGEIRGTPAIGTDGTIYIGNYGDKNVYAINPDGTLKWSYNTVGTIRASPAIGADGTIYIGDKNIYALNPDGTLNWTYATKGAIWGVPAIGADGTVYIGSQDKKIYALNPDGTLKWSYNVGGFIDGSPSIGSDGTVYIAPYNKLLIAFPGVVTGTADATSGTAPLDVQFTGTSELNVTSWHWDFGDGTTSTEQNPAHTYASAGTYTVNLTVTHADGTNYLLQTDYIKAYAPPTAGFAASVTSGLFPLAVSFTDQSTGSPTSWAWDFENDGIVDSTEQNPEHTYTAAGTYTVNLTATNAAGSDAEVKTDYITVSAPAIPRVSFTASHRVGIAPLIVRFADTSSSNPTSWLWDFGDGNASTEQNPAHTYTAVGKYNVSLTATNAYGSNATAQADYIVVTGTELAPLPAGQSLNLYVANDEGVKYNVENGVTESAKGYTPYVFIDNTYHFIYGGGGGGTNALHVSNDPSATAGQVTTTTDQSGEFWLTFTGGQPNLHDAVLLLAVNGTIPDDFSVRIRSSGYDFEPPIPSVGNNNTIGDPVYVDGAINQTFTKEDFIYGPQIWRPHRVSDYPVFVGQDMSDTGNTFELMFIDLRLGCTQTKSDGVVRVEYEFNNLTSFAVFNGYGWYSASNHGTGLIMTTSGSEYQVVGDGGSPEPELPVANFTANMTSGDAPLAVQFTDASTGSPTAWAWDFGNDGTIDSTEQSPTHTYTAAGTYTVNLTVTNDAGSDAGVKTDYITVTSSSTTCELPQQNGLNLTVINKQRPSLYDSEHPGTYFFNIGNNMYNGGQNAIHISDSYLTPDGTITVTDSPTGTFYVTDTGGKGYEDEAILLIAVQENELSEDFSIDLAVEGYKFLDHAANVAPTADEVGDFNSEAYVATLNASDFLTYDGALVSQAWKPSTGSAGDVNMKFFDGQDLAGPKYNLILVDLNTSIVGRNAAYQTTLTNYGNPKVTYTIHGYSGGNVSFAPYAYVSYQTGGGSYFDRTVGWASRSSTNSWLVTLSEAGTAPVADFSADVTSGDAPLAVQFTDLSTNSPTSWAWDFENNGIVDSTEQNPTFTYTIAGTYAVNLTVTNAAGSDSEVKTDYITVSSGGSGDDAPVADFTANVTSGDAPLSVQFTDASSGSPTTWFWEFGDNETSTEQGPGHTYSAAGNYTINLTVTNAAGSNSTIKADYITVTAPVTALPDLTVSTLTPNNGEVFSNSDNTYTAKITNIGTGDAGAFAVGFNVSGVTGTVAVAGLAAGANTTVTWTDETVRTAGDPATVTATADPENTIAEADEENNHKTLEKTVVNNGYRGKRWTAGEDIMTVKTYDVRGDLAYSSGTSTYLSAGTGWTNDTVTWTAGDLMIPANATITAARLYVPYTEDKGPVFPANASLTFNGVAVEGTAHHTDEKLWGTSYPYGMTVYDVTDAFSTDGNTAVLANAYPGGGNVSVRGMLLAVVYDDGVTAPHTILMNEGFDLLYGGEAQSTTPEQATAYAPFILDPAKAAAARLVTVAPGAGPTEGDLLFNDERFENVWNYTSMTQIGLDDRDVTAFLAGENLAGFRSDADYMEAAAAFLVVEYAPEPGSIAVTSTPTGAAVFLDGTETGAVTNCLLTTVPAGDHVVTLTLEGYADASAPVTVVSGETAEVSLELTTLTGSLAVTSTPEGAAILIDGAETGAVTNATLDGIAVGTHTVTLQKDGYVDATAEVVIEYNATTSLHLDLIKALGSIAVTSAPEGARIFLDGTDTGEVTNATLTVPAGEHTVTVTKPGYADASATVTVGHDQTVPVHFGLVPPTGSLAVTSTPDGARIYLDGLETGEVTNATLVNVPAGAHTVRVERDGYREAEAAVTVTAGGTASCHLDLEKIVVLPVADFSASVTAGTAPLTVLFTDASTGDPTSWAWAFGDGTTSTEQNPIYTYLTAGTYTVSLRVTNEDGSNSTTKPDYIAVTVLQGDQTQEAPLDIPGCNVTTDNDGKTHLEINTTEAGAQVTGNRVTIPQETYTLTIETEGEPGNESGTITGTVARIRLDTRPVITELDAIGTVSASVSANLTGIPAEAALTTTVSRDVAPDARSAFQLAASGAGLNLGDVAYTLNIVRTNLENTHDIAGATIRMTVSPAWVEAHDGADAIRIIRFAGDTREVLPTRFVGTDAGGNLVFEADSPNGFSVFGLATVSAVPQPAPSRSSGGGGSQASVGAAGNLKAGDRVVLAMDRTAISAVTFTAKNEVSDVMVTMAKGSLPRDAKAPTGTVYQYIEATLYKAAAEDFSSVQFRFAVPTNWLAAQGCTKDEVGLFRLTDDGWREVPVEALGEENGNAIFAASPEGFSLFAITATGKAPGVEEPTLEPIETETTPPADVTTPVDTTPTTPQPTPLPVGIAVLALGVSLLLVRRRT